MYEIVRLYFTDRTNPEQYRDYRLLVKSRLNGPYKVRKVISLIPRSLPSHTERIGYDL